MNSIQHQPVIVEKSIIGSLHFPYQDVLQSDENRRQRRMDAEKGMILGNNYKCKVKIVFEDEVGVKQIETTIWSVTEKWVLIKTGMGIPLSRIYSVNA